MDHMRISGNEPSSVILSQTKFNKWQFNSAKIILALSRPPQLRRRAKLPVMLQTILRTSIRNTTLLQLAPASGCWFDSSAHHYLPNTVRLFANDFSVGDFVPE